VWITRGGAEIHSGELALATAGGEEERHGAASAFLDLGAHTGAADLFIGPATALVCDNDHVR